MSLPVTEAAVWALQAEMLKHPQQELPTEHIFHGGMYCRLLARPAGALIVGKKHTKDHFYMVVEGTVRIGKETITGPRLFQCKAGTKRAVYALTDALCMTFHATDKTDVESVEAEIVEPDPTSPFLPGNKLPAKELT